MKIQTLTLFCTAVFALTVTVQDTVAQIAEKKDVKKTWRSRTLWEKNGSKQQPETQQTDHVKIGHDMYVIGSTLAGVNSRRSADAAAKKLLPIARDLSVQFRHEEARRALPRDYYERLVANIHAVDLHIVELRRVSFYGSTKLGLVCHEIERISYPVTQSRHIQPEITAGTQMSRTMPTKSVLAPRPAPVRSAMPPPTTLPPLLSAPPVR